MQKNYNFSLYMRRIFFGVFILLIGTTSVKAYSPGDKFDEVYVVINNSNASIKW